MSPRIGALLLGGAALALVAAGPPRSHRDERVTFTQDIAPILFTNCAPCHRPGGPAPFSLLTYAEVRQRAQLIAQVTRRRYMPPWKAVSEVGPFVGQHLLTDAELDRLARWAARGAPQGDPRDLPPQPRWTAGWQQGEPDLTVTFPLYTLPPAATDVFRIFVLPVPIDTPRFVRGLEFRPGNARVVHHANIRIDSTTESRRRDEADPEPGYDGLLARTAVYPEGHFFGWTPGQVAPLLPEGLGWRLEPGTDLVVQLHMQPSGKPEPVQPSIGLFFASTPPSRTPAMLRLGRQSIDIPPGERHYVIEDTYRLPVDVELLAVQPHAHYLARRMEGSATLPDGTTKRLIVIDDWDFRWQHVYRYETPLQLPKGTVLAMRFTYDNSADNPRNPQHPPRRAGWGQRSIDEMGDLWFQVVTKTERDLALLNADIRKKMVAEDIVGYEMVIRREPNDPALHDDVAMFYLELGRTAEAVAHFRTSLQLRPQSLSAHYNLATALLVAGALDEAVTEFERALALDPTYANAHNNLAQALRLRGRRDEAETHYRQALALDPGHVEARNNLGHLLLEAGRLGEAMGLLQEAVARRSTYVEAHYNLGRARLAAGRTDLAVHAFDQALALRPDWVPALTALAWTLATAPEAATRDPVRAVRLAEQAAALTGRRDAAALDVLAAAYAAAGRFDEAVRAAEAALALAPPPPLAAAIARRLEDYRERQPYIEANPPSARPRR